MAESHPRRTGSGTTIPSLFFLINTLVRYQELTDGRTTLPLSKGSIARARGSYGSLIVVMKPLDFLTLTTFDEANRQEIFKAAITSLDDYATDSDETFGKSDHGGLPFLYVSYPSGQITGHEGRHRAAMVLKAGGKSFPVMIYFRDDYQYLVTYEKYDAENDVGEDHEEPFSDRDEAGKRAAEIKLLGQDLDQPFSYYDIKVRIRGGMPLRGHPERSDFSRWTYAAWKPSDMPEFLIGQYFRTIKVPTSSMRVGIVKGYRHYS